MNICIQGPGKCFPGFLRTFSRDFHNISVHSVFSLYISCSIPIPVHVIRYPKELFLWNVALARASICINVYMIYEATKGKFPGENHMVWISKTKHTSSFTSSQYRKDFNYCRCKFDHLWVWLLATAPLSYVTCLIITQMNRNAIFMLSYMQVKWTVMENVHRSYWIIQAIHKTFHQSQFLSQLGRKLHPL